MQLTRSRAAVVTAAPPLVAAVVAMLLSTVVPLLGSLLIALALGATVANTRLSTHPAIANHHRVTKNLLRLGVAALGLQLPLSDILSIGPAGLLIIATTVLVTYRGTLIIGRRMGLDDGFVVLMAAGFSICGAAAIAAIEDVVRAKQRFVALSVALVTIFGTAMIVLVPWMARATGLTDQQSAIWIGASIHEVAQVVAAGSVIGASVTAVATTVKLGRVAMLAPICSLAGRGGESGKAPLVPWFIIVFACAVALRSTGWLPGSILGGAKPVTTVLLGAGMFGLGLGIRFAELWPLPMQAFILAVASTALAAVTSLVLVVTIA